MERIARKRILGLLIIVFAFIVFTPKNVFASEACDNAKKVFEDTAFSKYGISFKYDREAKVYKIHMSDSAATSAFAVNSANENESVSLVFKIVEFKITSNGGQTITLKGSDVLADDTITPNKTITLSKSLTPKLFESFVPRIIQISLKPDGFMDRDLKAACGNTANFDMKAEVTVEIYDQMPSKTYNFGGGLTGWNSSAYKKTDCANYKSKYAVKSFEYSYCDDMAKAKAAGAKEYTYGDKGGGTYEKYSDKEKSAADLKCDYKINRKNQYIWQRDSETGLLKYDENGEKIPNPDYYNNVNYFIGYGVFEIVGGTYNYNVEFGDYKSEEAKCKVECDEVVTVEYGQPVASMGGLCFEYKVRVTSRVSCGMLEEPNKPKSGTVCTPTPECTSSSYVVHTQGGPNKAFDKCVKSCDGGKYTDKCTNKCYQQVYGKSKSSSRKTVTGSEISYATKVYNPYEDSYDYPTNAAKDECIYKVDSDNDIIWETDYQRKDGDTVIACDSTWHRENTWGFSTSDYQITHNGIPATKVCTEDCDWIPNDSSECTSSSNPIYLNDPETYAAYHKVDADGKKAIERDENGNAKKDKDGNEIPRAAKSQIELDMEKNKKVYESLKTSCAAAVTCNTSTADFTISVSYTDKGTQKKETVNYPYTTDNKDKITYNKDSNVTSCTSNSNRFTTILESDGCYNCGNPSAKNYYRTEWSFPGVWVHGKNQNIKYKVDESEMSKYELWQYKFCLPTNIADVNTKWFNYYYKVAGLEVSTESKTVTCDDGTKTVCNYAGKVRSATFTDQDAKSIKDGGKIDYNIVAKARKFGFFEWNIDISCFYAVNTKDTTCSCGDPVIPPPGQGDGPEEKYRIRNVDLENLFPDSEANQLTSSDKFGRDLPFNWGASATQTKKDANYKSMPENYAKWIQAKGYGIYDDNYLDYEIDLTKEMINTIRKDGNNYTKWSGTVNTPGKVENKSASNYHSKLIRETLKDHAKYPNEQALLCNNIGDHTPSAGYSAECQEFNGEAK